MFILLFCLFWFYYDSKERKKKQPSLPDFFFVWFMENPVNSDHDLEKWAQTYEKPPSLLFSILASKMISSRCMLHSFEKKKFSNLLKSIQKHTLLHHFVSTLFPNLFTYILLLVFLVEEETLRKLLLFQTNIITIIYL